MSSKRKYDDMFVNVLNYLEEEKEENHNLSKRLKYVENEEKETLKKENKLLKKNNTILKNILEFGINNNNLDWDHSLNQYENSSSNNIYNWYSKCSICRKYNINIDFNNNDGIRFKYYNISGRVIDKYEYYRIIPSILTIPDEIVCICHKCHKKSKKEINEILLRRYYHLDKNDILYYNLNKTIGIKFKLIENF